MNRLGIFVFYNSKGRADQSVIYLLNELRTVVDTLYVAVNGSAKADTLKKFYEIADYVVVRQNKGLDAGAYIDVIFNYIKENNLHKYDELVFCNDSFYGPFISFQKIFEEMQNIDADYWGLDRVDRGILDHIRSYFLVFRKSCLEGVLTEYLYSYRNILNYGHAAAILETNLFETFSRSNLKGASYVYTENYDPYISGDICIRNYSLPVLKKKNIVNGKCSLAYIECCRRLISEKYKYPIAYIASCSVPTQATSEVRILKKAAYKKQELLDWCNKESFYIFGIGVIATELFFTYFQNNANMKGFVVSEKKSKSIYGKVIFDINEIEKKSRILLGVKVETAGEVENIYKDEFIMFNIWE